MSEGSGIHNPVKPESQSIRGCAELREKCQREVFDKIDDQREKLEDKMDAQHKNVMKAIGGIDKKMAFQEGKNSVEPKIDINMNGKKEWKKFFVQMTIQWGPIFLLIILLGLREWLKKNGWM